MDYQVAIIGGGPAGYTAAEKAGKSGLKVILFEKEKIGGVCLNEGCIPTKTLLYSAKLYQQALDSKPYGISIPEASFDIKRMVSRKNKTTRKLTLGINNKLKEAQVTIVQGAARIVDPHTIQCNGESYTFDNLLICTGSLSITPPIKGLSGITYWTHKEALEVKELPQSLIIIGGGVIGMEFASLYNSLGVDVTIIEQMDELLGNMDKELTALLREEYSKKKLTCLLNTTVTAVEPTEENKVVVHYENSEGKQTAVADQLLLSVGRKPQLADLGLENIELDKTEQGRIKINRQMQTSQPHIFLCGDANGKSLLAHTAIREAEVAVHTLLSKEDAMNYQAIPSVIYTNPEFAGVGETEESLKAKEIEYRKVTLPLAYSGRFVAENERTNGVCKLLFSKDDTLLGAHVLGNPASEIITLAGMAIELGLTAEEWNQCIFPHPTVGEIFKEALQ